MSRPAGEPTGSDGHASPVPPAPADVPPPPPPTGNVPPPPPPAGAGAPPANVLRAQSRSLVARLDPTGTRPTATVGAIILLLFLGSQLLNAVVPAAAGGPGVQPAGWLDVGPVRIHLAPGWQAAQGPDGPRLARGSVAVDIATPAFAGDAATLYDAFINQALAPQATGFGASAPTLVSVGPGIAGARGAYTGIFGDAGEIEGQLTTFVRGGSGFVFDAWGPAGTLAPLLPDVELMLGTIELQQ